LTIEKSEAAHALETIATLEKKYSSKLKINSDLSRKIVSFQQNKAEPIFQWFSYREGFSKQLVDYLFNDFNLLCDHNVLDPFAGSGATLFCAQAFGASSQGFELLPVGKFFVDSRLKVNELGALKIIDLATKLLTDNAWKECKDLTYEFQHLSITEGCFPAQTEKDLNSYISYWEFVGKHEAWLSKLVVFCILERISFTRKDGQYLRWDYRAVRKRVMSKFDKGVIPSFEKAASEKLHQIIETLSDSEFQNNLYFENKPKVTGKIKIEQGSNFDLIDSVENESIDCIVTSPPYCNRYDYTRTYALELAFLGINQTELSSLRQQLLTCTVENRPKTLPNEKLATDAVAKYYNHTVCAAIDDFLRSENNAGRLNNSNIERMVRGYLIESAYHIGQIAEKMNSNAAYYMVNDNVQYNGVQVPIDLILSDFAESYGLECDVIWVLPVSKGNSSQQMAKHGRIPLRKCVYKWRKT
jgi:hypothetical protein